MSTTKNITEELDRRIGEVIRRFRAINKMTQAELAQQAGVTQGYISQLENGRRNTKMTLANLQRISSALQFDTLSSMIEAAEGIAPKMIGQRLDHLLKGLTDLKSAAIK